MLRSRMVREMKEGSAMVYHPSFTMLHAAKDKDSYTKEEIMALIKAYIAGLSN